MDISSPLVMVSGGPDSVALLCVISSLGGNPTVVHVDHGLRGEESAGDARFVEKLCRELPVPFIIRKPDIRPGAGMQERARAERYRIALEVLRATGSSSVALGHNADDVAETVLMNLSRGSGMRGLAGIPPVRDEFIRPLIDIPRSRILRYLEDIGQEYRVDSTNATGKYTRNRMRLDVLPVLESMFRGASENIHRAAGLVHEDLHVLETVVSGATEVRDDRVVIRPQMLSSDPEARRTLIGHAVRSAFRMLRPGADMPRHETVRKVSAAVSPGLGSRSFDLPLGVRVIVVGDAEVVVRERGSDDAGDISEVPLGIGESEFPGWRIRVERVPALDVADARRPEVAYLEGGRGYAVRRVREGDTIRPVGLGGTKTVLRAMMDRKVRQDERRDTPVVVDDSGEVAWVFLGETDEGHAVTAQTQEIIRLEVEKI